MSEGIVMKSIVLKGIVIKGIITDDVFISHRLVCACLLLYR